MARTDALAEERRHLQEAAAHRAAMRRRTTGLAASGGSPQGQQAVARMLAERAHDLGDRDEPPAFGRIDYADGVTEDGREWFHIGRRHIHDEYGDAVVVDWRAPVARPFYTASVAHPAGLHRRRRFLLDGSELADVVEEHFLDEILDDLEGDVAQEAAQRRRDATMRDIVATIHAEQDELIRAPLDQTLVVQGGPGTGKTAVALHRAAYLLYEHRDRLEREGILVVGPNRAFMRYIADVLPGLGELQVEQRALGDVPRRLPTAPQGPAAVRRLKGDIRMRRLVNRALAAHRQPARRGLDIALRHRKRTVRLGADQIDDVVSQVASEPVAWTVGQDRVRQRLTIALLAAAREQGVLSSHSDERPLEKDVRASSALKAAVEAVWPTLDAEAVLRSLLSDVGFLAACAEGLVSPAEQRAVIEASAQAAGRGRWAPEDIALLDELDFQVSNDNPSYGHVVVDEAQDLSAMQLRMLARRCSRSMTVVGDLAQGSAAWAAQSWEEVLALVEQPSGAVVELVRGYRVPQQHLTLANRLLPSIARDVAPTESVREGERPTLRTPARSELLPSAVAEARRLLAAEGSVGVIVADGARDQILPYLAAADIPVRAPADVDSDARVCLAEASEAKGLEFDHVVLVEPAAIAARSARGLSLLYVALTRAVHELVVLHAEPLPDALAPAAAAAS